MPDTNGTPTTRPESCAACRFWTAPTSGALGICRRFPRVERKEGVDWCGEFAAVKAAVRLPVPPRQEADKEPIFLEQVPEVTDPVGQPSTRSGRRRKGGQ